MNTAVRRALVTGGSSGIGRCVVETLAREGCDVGFLYVGAVQDAEPVLAAIAACGRRGWARVCDVRSSDEVHGAIESFVAGLGGLEILVNNAGVFRDQVVWKMTDEQWEEVIDVDLGGVFRVTRAALPTMRRGGGGAIVNISSINGLRGKFGQTNYSAAKAGVIGFTKALAREVARFDITVNAVAPGLIDTPAIAGLPQAAREEALGDILLGRIGRPQDVADAVAFLCGARARFITGAVLHVDGGQYI